MKPVSDKFKESIKKYGRKIDAIITYTDKEGEHLLDSDVLFSITPTVNGNILKSVMKQLEFESSVKVPKGAIIKAQLGVQIDLSLTVSEINAMLVERLKATSVNLLSAGLKGFEYITFGNYIVSEEPEYNADTLSYYHKCYDKMLYSMKEYEKLSITYPISIRDYLKKICSHLGLTFKNANDIFANYNKQIKTDLYDGYDYTFRDILDELAQVTASTICINENTDELEIRYLNNTQDCINEDYLKDVNVEFGKVYGPINSIVLSRAGESDNVYLPNEESIQENGLCELKIIDNQIMNDNDRSDYLPDILAKLNETSYCINDFSSYGITWYDLCDLYTVEIGTKKYNCVLLNDEIKITQGLEETIYTEMPTVSETDYTKADKTDRRINKAYIIVDKQNQKIELLVSQQSETGEKLSKVEQTVDGITETIKSVETKVETAQSTANTATTKADNAQTSANNAQSTANSANTKADNAQNTANTANTNAQNAQKTANANATKITTTTTKLVEVEKTVEGITQSVSEIETKIGENSINNGTFENGLTGWITSTASTTSGSVTVQTVSDAKYAQIVSKSDTTKLLQRIRGLKKDTEYTLMFNAYDNGDLEIDAEGGTFQVDIVQYKLGSEEIIEQLTTPIYVTTENKSYTVQFTPEEDIDAEAIFALDNPFVSDYSMSVMLSNVSLCSGTVAEQLAELEMKSNKMNLEVGKKVNNEDFTGANIMLAINNDSSSATINADKISLNGKEINLTSEDIVVKSDGFNVDKNGNVSIIDNTGTSGSLRLYTTGTNYETDIRSFGQFFQGPNGYVGIEADFAAVGGTIHVSTNQYDFENCTYIQNGSIECVKLTQTSLEERKKNIEKLQDNAIDIIKNIDIYKYNLKSENDTDKKHIGFVIGEGYNYSEEVTSLDNKGVDNYSFTSLCCKALQEQQEMIESLQKQVKELKEGK